MTKADVKRLLRKAKLSGKEAALLIMRHEWEEETAGQGFLSGVEIETIKGSIPASQHATFNDYMRLYDIARHAGLDTELLALKVSAACGDLIPIVMAYSAERLLRVTRALLPHVVTAQEYEERRLAQREDKLLEPVSILHVLSWYLPQDELASERLLQEAEAFEKWRAENDETYYDGLLTYVLGEGKEPELARPWLEWLLEMLRSGRLEPVYYTEEASDQARGYLENSRDYASIYEEQSRRPGARDAAGLIEAIEQYLAGELEPVKLDDRLWDTFVTGAELYETGIERYKKHIDTYDPDPPDWPIMAILQDEPSLEGRLLIDRDTGLYKREHEDKYYRLVTQFEYVQRNYSEIEGGLEGFLSSMMGLLAERLGELRAFELGLQAVSKVLGIAFLETESIAVNTWLAHSKVRSLNFWINAAKVKMSVDSGLLLPIEPIELGLLEPDGRAVELINSRMGKFLSSDWAQQELEMRPENEPQEEGENGQAQ